ncbi:MAG: hypothetical protein ACE5JQ_11415 [Candidatus Methylomirabilales bacterium]
MHQKLGFVSGGAWWMQGLGFSLVKIGATVFVSDQPFGGLKRADLTVTELVSSPSNRRMQLPEVALRCGGRLGPLRRRSAADAVR